MLRPILAIFCLALFASAPAWSLTDEEVFRDLRFNLINPGARSLALGGAFISLADDATAAQANPAGLAFLNAPEYFFELRLVDNAAESSVRSEVLPTDIETFVATGTDLDDVVTPSFLSAVTPYGKWTMALSLQELLNIENSTLSSFAFTFPNSPGAFLAQGEGQIDMRVTNLNVSVGVRATERLSVGATLTLSRLDVDSEVVNRIVDTGGNLTDEPVLVPTLDLRTRIDDDDDEVVGTLGLVYKQPDKWSFGAVYRRAPEFVLTQIIDPDPMQDSDGDGNMDPYDSFGVRGRLGGRFLNRFHLPDSLGVGANWLPGKSSLLTLALDVERIFYSNLMDGYVSGVNVLTDEDADFDLDDGTDYRVGAEYILLNERNSLPPLALRAGFFSESDSTIRARSTGTASFATPDVFQGRDRQSHGTIGIGVNFQRYKVDLAADFSESDNEYLVSVIYRSQP